MSVGGQPFSAQSEVDRLRPSPAPFPAPKARVKSSAHVPLTILPAVALWTLPLNNALTAPPAFDATQGYFPLEGDQLAAYELATGTRTWVVSMRTDTRPVAGSDLLFVVEPDALTALRTADGSIAWQLPFADKLAVPLVWDTGWLVAATTAGAVLAFRASDGQLIWRHDVGSPAHAPPALAAHRVYVPASDGRIVALRIESGEPLWEHRLRDAPNEILPLDDRLYVGSNDKFFYCLNTADGLVDWRWRTGGDAIGMPVIDERSVYFVALDNVLRALNRSSGVQRWKRALPLRPTSGPVKAADALVVAGITPALRAFYVRDGAPAGEMTAGGELAAPPHVFENPVTFGPVLVVVTRSLAKGATVAAMTRAIEPPIAPVGPLPNPVVLPGMDLPKETLKP